MDFGNDLMIAKLHRLSAKTLILAKNKYDRRRNEAGLKKIPPFTYEPLTKPNAIRLLTIAPGAEHEPIACTVYEASLDDNPAYEALSYTWQMDTTFFHGDSGNSGNSGNETDPKAVQKLKQREAPQVKPIMCNGERLSIQLNLYHALAQFRRTPRPHPLWIDQICIDQNDEVQRHQQIELMGRIYSSAKRTLVWLGKSSAIHELAIRVMSKASVSSPESAEDMPDDMAALRETGVYFMWGKGKQSEPTDVFSSSEVHGQSRMDQHAHAVAILRILRRGWFSRTWTLQELLLAKEISVCIGSHEIPPQALANGAKWLLHFYASDAVMLSFYGNFIKTYKHLFGIPAFFNSRRQFVQGKRWTLEEYTAIVRTRNVTEPRDKVYAGFSLLDRSIPYAIGSTAEVYTSFTKALYTSQAGISSLSLVGDAAPSTLHLPSWVPELSSELRPKPLRYKLTHSFHTATHLSHFQRLGFDDKSETLPTLHLQATIWDTVRDVGETDWAWNADRWTHSAYSDTELRSRFHGLNSIEQLGRMFPLVTSLSRTYQHTGEPTIAVMCNCLLSGRYAGREEMPNDVKRSFCYHVVSKIATKVLLTQHPLWMYHYTFDRKATTDPDGALEAFSTDVLANLSARLDPFVECHDSLDFPLRESMQVAIVDAQKKYTARFVWDRVKQQVVDGSFVAKFLPFQALFDDLYATRRILVTEKGYLGTGVESTAKGDVIALIPGANVPYILRPVQGQQDTYRLIGEAYIHGIMDGQAVNEQTGFSTIKII